jgi:Predicted Fe-S oxidoreductases
MNTNLTDKKYVPLYCVWELTLQCNLRCLHCGSRAGKKREHELSSAEALNVADELITLGCTHVSLIGGEVFFYSRWEEIARKLSDNGLTVNVITNGYLMEEPQIREILYAGLSNVAISIDGLEEHHNKIRNNAASFSRLCTSIDRLNEHSIPVAVNTTLMRENFEDLDGLYTFLTDKGVAVWQLQLANPMGNLKAQNDKLITPGQMRELTTFIRNKRSERKISIYTGDNIGYYDSNEEYIRGTPGSAGCWQGCQAGLTGIGIDSVGNVKGCESLYDDRFIEGNIRNESLSHIWQKDGNFSYNRNFTPDKLEGKCRGCSMGQLCRAGCRGACYFTNGGLFENAYCTYSHTVPFSETQ